ncbi:hypothetical protein FVQ98_03005 [Ottowia sp. GY511]|uniref:DUF4019 domain-containing protein n=1 Tax=Ottowia flava TaxID=2675430 RepID=A0ABW4KSE8_9BURK|nr:hypothetical protein [Ottowia sp. GY511]TXK32970.1 hypothetical protein FVQ98_03005 [Ottowia sp. GY511]
MNGIKFIARRAALASALGIFSIGLWGCASSPSGAGAAAAAPAKADASPEALLKRAQAYWGLVRANDNVGAWAYEAQSRAPNASLEAYLKKGGITYSSVNVTGVKSIEGDTGMVDVTMKYSLPLLRVRDRDLRTEDQWKLIEGVWYHSPPKSGLFPTK